MPRYFYTTDPFDLHFGLIGNAEMAPGELRFLNGSVSDNTPVLTDTHLATLYFKAMPGQICAANVVVSFIPVFEVFKTEMSFLGNPIMTQLDNPPAQRRTRTSGTA